MAERRYSEKEASLILRKAALIQAAVAKEREALPSRETLEDLLLRMNEICRSLGSGAIGSIGLARDMRCLKGTSGGVRMSARIHGKPEGGASIAVSADLRSAGGGIFGGYSRACDAMTRRIAQEIRALLPERP